MTGTGARGTPAQHLTLCTGSSLKNEEVQWLEVGQTVSPAEERAQLGCSHGSGTALVPVLPRRTKPGTTRPAWAARRTARLELSRSFTGAKQTGEK